MRPLVIGTSVVSIRMSVLLPAPFGPSSPSVSPGAMLSDTPSTAVNFP